MWDPPGTGLEPVSPVLAGGFLTTAPPGKSRGWGDVFIRQRSGKLGLGLVIQADTITEESRGREDPLVWWPPREGQEGLHRSWLRPYMHPGLRALGSVSLSINPRILNGASRGSKGV